MEEYASRIVPVHPFVYLNKQDGEEKIYESLNFLLDEVRRHHLPRLPVRDDGRVLLLKPSDILYITIRGKGSELWLTEEAKKRLRLSEEYVKSSARLEVYYEQLKDFGFIYAHKSYIVNAEHIIMRNKSSIILESGCELNVARSRQKAFDQELSAYLGIRYLNSFNNPTLNLCGCLFVSVLGAASIRRPGPIGVMFSWLLPPCFLFWAKWPAFPWRKG